MIIILTGKEYGDSILDCFGPAGKSPGSTPQPGKTTAGLVIGFLMAAVRDPAKLGRMVGSPPPAERIVRFTDGSYWRFPALRWSVCHMRQLAPTVNVSRGPGNPVPLPRSLRDDIEAVRFIPLGGKEPMTWACALPTR